MRFLINAFVVIFAIVAVGIAVKFYQTSSRSTVEMNRERYDRMVAEEKLTGLDSKVNSLEIDLARSQNEAESLQRRLNELRKDNETLKEQLTALNEAKKESQPQPEEPQSPPVGP